jgi:hypothetical protein
MTHKDKVHEHPTKPLLHVTFIRPSTASTMFVIFKSKYLKYLNLAHDLKRNHFSIH